MDENKNSLITIIIAILGYIVALSLLFNGRFLIGVFGFITCTQILKLGLRKKTNANNAYN